MFLPTISRKKSQNLKFKTEKISIGRNFSGSREKGGSVERNSSIVGQIGKHGEILRDKMVLSKIILKK